MTKKVVRESTVDETGLRYVAKKSGSMFGASLNTMSCFFCGNHFAREELETKKVLGGRQYVCKGGCKKVKAGD